MVARQLGGEGGSGGEVVESCRCLRCEKILKTVVMNKMKNKNNKDKTGMLIKKKCLCAVALQSGGYRTQVLKYESEDS